MNNKKINGHVSARVGRLRQRWGIYQHSISPTQEIDHIDAGLQESTLTASEEPRDGIV